MVWVRFAVALLFAVFGVIFLRGKGAVLIAGYNTSSAEEKERIDEKKLCRFMGKLMLIVAACCLVAATGEWLHIKPLLWSGQALLPVVVIAGVIYANTGHRFDKE